MSDEHEATTTATPAGLGKDEIRRIVLDKLRVVYDDWGFEDFMTVAGERREDARAFVIALVAGLVGGFTEAIDRNNEALARSRRVRRRGSPRLRSLRALDGYRVEGEGGPLGEVVDAYFDDHSWTVRYLMIAPREPGAASVLLSPHSFRRIDRRARTLVAALTPAQLRATPGVGEGPAISRAAEAGLLKYFGFPYYWTGRHRWGDDVYPRPLATSPAAGGAAPAMAPADEAHLRSVRDFRRYAIHATDGELGHVDDLLVEERSWAVRYIVVDTRRWWPGGRVVLAPGWVDYVSWVERSVHVSLDRATIRTAPSYDRRRPIDRAYEARLHEHYGRPKYWTGRAA